VARPAVDHIYLHKEKHHVHEDHRRRRRSQYRLLFPRPQGRRFRLRVRTRPIDPQGNIVAGSIESEVALTLDNVKALLAAAGARMDQVVKCTCYLADIADFDAFDRVYRTYFGEVKPTRTTVAAGLSGIKIEIDAMAYVGR